MKITKRLDLKSLYTIRELREVGAVPLTQNGLRRMLVRNGIVFLRTGSHRTLYVPLSEISQKMPEFWKSIELVDRLRRKSING